MFMHCKRKCFAVDIAESNNSSAAAIHQRDDSSLQFFILSGGSFKLRLRLPLLPRPKHSQDELLMESNGHLNVRDLNIY